METTVYNPQKGRLETIEIELKNFNTTWFHEFDKANDINSITDFHGGLLISVYGYEYPELIYGVTRASIGFSRNRAFKLRKSNLQG